MKNPLYDSKLKELDKDVISEWVLELVQSGKITKIKDTGSELLDNKSTDEIELLFFKNIISERIIVLFSLYL